jgi:HEAT repeat protein
MITTEEIRSYLTKICQRHEQWWTVDPLTETIADRQATFSFFQTVQTEEDGEKIPPLDLFQAIQNYIESEHILLVGSPGVGKSTSLLRCLVNFAKVELEKSKPRIPVLVRLKRYKESFSCPKDRSGMLGLIKDTLEPELWLELVDIQKLLFKEERLILILDGLNEMSSGTVRTEIDAFRKKCERCNIPLICTTREGGGNLGIKRRLDVQPLSSQEIERFLRECMPSQAQQVWQLLNRDNRELSRTPFVLWMLYNVFQETGTVSETLGEAFRQFFRSFKKHKENVPVNDERRKDWNPWMEHLAFTMLDSPDLKDPGLVISDERAEKVLSECFGDLHGNSSRIEELLKYHLLERVSDKEISFHHQLIQEYYAAEYLLPKLAELTKNESDQNCTAFQINYLNYLKWTEVITLMLGLREITENQAVRVVKLALKVDFKLGARLAGEVKQNIQPQTIQLIETLEISLRTKLFLMKIARSQYSVPYLKQILEDQDGEIEERWEALWALGRIRTDSAIVSLVQILKSQEEVLSQQASFVLQNIDIRQYSEQMLEILSNPNVALNARISAISIFEESSTPELAKHNLKVILEDPCENVTLQQRAALTFARFDESFAVGFLHQTLKSENISIRGKALQRINLIRSRLSVQTLINFIGDKNEENGLRRFALETLKKIGLEENSESFLTFFLDRDESDDIREGIAYLLISSNTKNIADHIFSILENEDESLYLRCALPKILASFGDEDLFDKLAQIFFKQNIHADVLESVIYAFRYASSAWILNTIKFILENQNNDRLIIECIRVLEALENDDAALIIIDILKNRENTSELRRRAAYSLRRWNNISEIFIELVNILQDESETTSLRGSAASALVNSRAEVVKLALMSALKNTDPSVRACAAQSLGSIGGEDVILALKEALGDSEQKVSTAVISSLTQIISPNVVEPLSQAISQINDVVGNNNTSLLRDIAASLGNSGSEHAVEPLFEMLYLDEMVRLQALKSLERVAPPSTLPRLLDLPETISYGILDTVEAIQSRCGFYNYEFHQKHLALMKLKSENTTNSSLKTNITQNFWGTVNGVAGSIEGNQNIFSSPQCHSKKEEYERILSSLQSMSITMERHPETFCSIQEEALRDYFLVYLNGDYKGKATGETTNRRGKTDIMVRLQDENVFIGECKFWKGKEALLRTLDQLLGYVTWRDNQLGVLVFSRNKNFSAVLGQIAAIIREHSSFSQESDHSETRFRFVLKYPNDAERKMDLTILVFNIPSDSEEISKN